MTTADTSPMSGLELYLLRTTHGIQWEDFAQILGVSERTIRRWQAGISPVPAWVAGQARGLDARIDQVAARIDQVYQGDGVSGAMVEIPDTAAGLPRWAVADNVPLSLWRSAAVRAHVTYGVRLVESGAAELP